MKKTISVLLCALVLFFCFIGSAAAQPAPARIKAVFHTQLAGRSDQEMDSFAELSGGDLMLATDEYGHRSFVCYCTEELCFEKMKPGRTYYIHYLMKPRDGYAFPDELTEDNIDFVCEKGGEVVWCYYVCSPEDMNSNDLYVCVKVTVPGNIFERIFGGIADIILKIRTWSLY